MCLHFHSLPAVSKAVFLYRLVTAFRYCHVAFPRSTYNE